MPPPALPGSARRALRFPGANLTGTPSPPLEERVGERRPTLRIQRKPRVPQCTNPSPHAGRGKYPTTRGGSGELRSNIGRPQRALTLPPRAVNLVARQMKTSPSIGEYLIQRLYAHGVRHVFGIPGDYVLGFYDQLSRSKLRLINTCDEQGAGFAADAYARVRGLGAVCVTYCVGGLKLTNTTAEAFAEKSPVVVISGAPGMKEREKNPLLHHKVREFDTQKKVFEQLTIASTVLSDPQTAFQEIDRVLHAALRFKRPVYIELPRDLVSVPGIPHHKTPEIHERSDSQEPARGAGRSRADDQRRAPAGHPGGRGGAPVRLAGPAPQARAQDQYPRGRDRAREVRHWRAPSVLSRHL